MPRDKTASHARIVAAAMEEFRTKGFEQASMKAVADAVGMTSAALYRHFASKQAMFAALVQPALEELEQWKEKHIAASMDMLQEEYTDRMWDFEADMNDARMVLDVMYRQPEAFYLLLCCSAGTPYATFAHDMVEEATERMLRFLQDSKAQGHPVRLVQPDEMHMLISGYCAALVQPIEHGYDKADAERYLKTIVEFFTPGWRWLTGL